MTDQTSEFYDLGWSEGSLHNLGRLFNIIQRGRIAAHPASDILDEVEEAIGWIMGDNATAADTMRLSLNLEPRPPLPAPDF